MERRDALKPAWVTKSSWERRLAITTRLAAAAGFEPGPPDRQELHATRAGKRHRQRPIVAVAGGRR